LFPYNKFLNTNSRELRKEMTPEEKELWYNFLRYLPFPVKRQKVIENFIVDFYIPKFKVVIEIDGSQHLEESRQKKDEKRDITLREYGIVVWRYSNESVNKRFNIVCNDILNRLGITYEEMKRPK